MLHELVSTLHQVSHLRGHHVLKPDYTSNKYNQFQEF